MILSEEEYLEDLDSLVKILRSVADQIDKVRQRFARTKKLDKQHLTNLAESLDNLAEEMYELYGVYDFELQPYQLSD